MLGRAVAQAGVRRRRPGAEDLGAHRQGRAQAAPGAAGGDHAVPPPGADARRQPGARRGPAAPAGRRRRQGAVRRAGRHRPADVHAVRQPRAAARRTCATSSARSARRSTSARRRSSCASASGAADDALVRRLREVLGAVGDDARGHVPDVRRPTSTHPITPTSDGERRRRRRRREGAVALQAAGRAARRLPRLPRLRDVPRLTLPRSIRVSMHPSSRRPPARPSDGAGGPGGSLGDRHTGCGAAWLARLTGGQEVGSSNLPSPTESPAHKG